MTNELLGSACPLPLTAPDHITLAHGGGGRMMHNLLERYVLPAFENPALGARHDGAVMEVAQGRLAFTTDSYVVDPLFFPGGDIGTLAVTGTVNDLAMCGARPLCLSAGLILEEGLPLEVLERVVASMSRIAKAASVPIVTGDEVKALQMTCLARNEGIFIVPILPPAVPPHTARIRATVTAGHSLQEIDRAINTFEKIAISLGILNHKK